VTVPALTVPALTVPALTVTALLSPHSIGFVASPTAQMLTKRRAVDFCHVATAICPRGALSR
jgi:hypothetical protein